MNSYAVAIHGGAGNAGPDDPDPNALIERQEFLREVARNAADGLRNHGTAVDTVVQAVATLEDCSLFNAGKGSVFAASGEVELDAAVMNGETGQVGGVSTLKTVRHPIFAAREVLLNSPHSLICGEGAKAFTFRRGLEMVDQHWFHTEHRLKALHRAQQRGGFHAEDSLGTVGAIARDRNGNLAAATSTGGLTNKAPGRISDSCIPGAGTWAQNGLCAVSCTGTGDVFIRMATAHDIAALMAYGHFRLAPAVAEALRKLKLARGSGGVIAMDAAGHICIDYNTDRMCWAWATEEKEAVSNG